MDTQLCDAQAVAQTPEIDPLRRTIDPLKRVFVPIERRNAHGILTFRTSDGQEYYRNASGSIRTRFPKVNGKLARKLRAEARRANR